MKRYLTVLGLALIGGCAYLPQSENAGLTADGRLRSCPRQPHCVGSQDSGRHHIEPLPWTPDLLERAVRVLERMPRTRIVTRTERYVHAEVTSRLLRFVDDLELLADPPNAVVAVRASSRLGYWDGGVNRARVEALREALSRLP